MCGKGIVGGYSDGTFKPANTVSRSNFVVMLSRAFYAEDVAKYDNDFNKSFGTFVPNYMAVTNNGVWTNVSFDNTTMFDPTSSFASEMSLGISRYDMAQLMTNIMSKNGFSASSSEKDTAIVKIADYNSIPGQYKDAVANVYALGIIGGYSDGTFGGTVTMNRGQAAVVIYRLAQYVGADSGTVLDPSANTELTEAPTTPNSLPDPVAPESKPETTSTDRTLANGKAITEANVTEILNQLKDKYPNKTDFSKGYAGLGSGRNAGNNCIAKVVTTYRDSNNRTCSTTSGCGGWAAFVADEIFGQTGVTWKKTTLANARPGDLMIKVDANGYLEHVQIYVDTVPGNTKDQKVAVTGATTTSGVYYVRWSNCVTTDTNYDIYTAYPD